MHLKYDLHHVKQQHLQNGWRGGKKEKGKEGEKGWGGEGRRGGKGREGKEGEGGREGRGGEERRGEGESIAEVIELLPAGVAGTGLPHSEVVGSTVQPVREESRKVLRGRERREVDCLYLGGGRVHGSVHP